jgi:small subunit ribosomal protein S20
VANIKSQIKRNRQNEAARVRNKAVRSTLKTAVKKTRTAADDGDAEASATTARQALRLIDTAVAKGTLHKRAAARRKSRLARQVNAVGAG